MSSAAAAADAPEEFAALADYTIDDFMSEAASDVEIFATTEGHGDVRAEEIRFLARDPDPPIATPRPKETAVKCSSAIFAEPRAPGAPHFYSAERASGIPWLVAGFRWSLPRSLHTILYTMYARGWSSARRGGRFRLLTAWLRLFRLRSN